MESIEKLGKLNNNEINTACCELFYLLPDYYELSEKISNMIAEIYYPLLGFKDIQNLSLNLENYEQNNMLNCQTYNDIQKESLKNIHDELEKIKDVRKKLDDNVKNHYKDLTNLFILNEEQTQAPENFIYGNRAQAQIFIDIRALLGITDSDELKYDDGYATMFKIIETRCKSILQIKIDDDVSNNNIIYYKA